MDASHVSLVAMMLQKEFFASFRCDRSMSLGLSLQHLSKVLKCAGKDDSITLKAEDGGDVLTLTFENSKMDRISEFELKLMDIDSEHLGIPETEYKAVVTMPSAEFARIVRDLSLIGDTCSVACGKEGVKFGVSGDLGTGSITIKQSTSADRPELSTLVEMEEPVDLSFALRYLNLFTKATGLSQQTVLSMSPDVPLVVEYKIHDDTQSYVRYYLAPKVADEETA